MNSDITKERLKIILERQNPDRSVLSSVSTLLLF